MGLKKWFDDLIFKLLFSKVPQEFISKDALLKLKFDQNWVYSKKGNSFYSFNNVIDDLKGSLQLSLMWLISHPDLEEPFEIVQDLVEGEEDETITFEKKRISKFNSFYYFKNYEDSNLDFHYWFIYLNKILIKITFMIAEDEPKDIKEEWKVRIDKILDSLELDEDKFSTTIMR